MDNSGLNRFLALLSFVRDNEEGIQQVKQYETAELVLLTLGDEGMDAYSLLRRCCHLEFGERLIKAIRNFFFKKGKFPQFLSGLVQMDRSWWDENMIDPPSSLNQLQGDETLEQVMKQHSNLLTDPEHPLYCESGPIADDYWSNKIQKLIKAKKFLRAWKELHKGHKGLLKATVRAAEYDKQQFIEICVDPNNRCWKASTNCIGELVSLLYKAMYSVGEIQNLNEEDHNTKPWDRIPEQIFDTHVPRGRHHKPREYTQWIDRPGQQLALLFVERELGGAGFDKKLRLKEEGAMIIKVAAHFRQQHNERCRAKYVQALAEY